MLESNDGNIEHYFYDKLYLYITVWLLKDTFDILFLIAAGL